MAQIAQMKGLALSMVPLMMASTSGLYPSVMSLPKAGTNGFKARRRLVGLVPPTFSAKLTRRFGRWSRLGLGVKHRPIGLWPVRERPAHANLAALRFGKRQHPGQR